MTAKELELKDKLSRLTDEQEKVIDEYCANDMKKLKSISFNAFRGYNIPLSEHDDLYDDAMNVLLESVVSYDGNQAACFNTFLTNNIKNSVADWYRDNYKRAKRRNLLRDKNGNIVRVDKNGNVTNDGKGNPIIIYDTSFDKPINEDDKVSYLSEKIASDFSIENESEIDFEADESVEEFLSSLPTIARRILELKMDGINTALIKQKLNITDSEYSRYMKLIKSNEKLELFSKTVKYKEDMNMNIMPIDVTDSYRMDKYPLGTLIDEKRDKKINTHYILQRPAYQWTKKQKNKFLTRVLNNQPIPEIVICEQIVGDKKKRHLIDGLQRLSYSSLYRAKGCVIEEEGAEFPDIYYTEFVKDENGNLIYDEDGDPKVEKKVFNVIGKTFDQLPEFLQDRFNKFNVNVTTFFNCDDEQIAYHIRNYNNQAPMNNNQYDMTCMNPEFAEMIKNISQKNLFFKDKFGKITNLNDIKGATDRLVAECIMSVNFLDDWKDKTESLFPYIQEHATKNMFDSLSNLFTRLCNVVTKETKELFNTSNTSTWVAVFNEFVKSGLEDGKFAEFLKYFIDNIDGLMFDGKHFSDIYKDRHPKNKCVITQKITYIVNLMKEYLHINEDPVDENDHEEIKSESDEDIVLGFAQSNVDPTVDEEYVGLGEDMVDTSFDRQEISVNSPLYQYCRTALIAIAIYACYKDKDERFDEWIKKYESNNSSFSPDQKVNYTYMKRDFDEFVRNAEDDSKQKVVAVA